MNSWCPCLFSCCQNSSSLEEREPILAARSARRIQTPNKGVDSCSHADLKDGRIFVRVVGLANLDERFNDLAESFNKQQDNYERLMEKRRNLLFRYRCSDEQSLSVCLEKIRTEHEPRQVRLQMNGYDFALVVSPNDNVPDKLQRTQGNVKELCQAVKAIMAIGPKLQQMIDSLSKDENKLMDQVPEGAGSHQDTRRLCDNLQWNLQEVSRAKTLSLTCRKEADRFLQEVTQLSGYTP